MAEEGVWRRCSSCKGDILLGDPYFTCSVSTCNTARAPLVFCSLECWQSHVPAMRHRDAWAEEHQSPAHADDAEVAPAQRAAPAPTPAHARGAEVVLARRPAPAPSTQDAPTEEEGSARRRRIVSGGDSTGAAAQPAREGPREVLIVASKLKSYIRSWGEMNTSERVLPVLSDHVRELSRRAVRVAAQDGRKTVLDRDFMAVLSKLEQR